MTAYDDIYTDFLLKISDLSIADYDEETFNKMITRSFNKAVGKFSSYCIQDLTKRDDEKQEFSIDLTDEEIDIITDYMVLMWLEPAVYNEENLKNVLNTSDYTFYSPASLLEKVKDLYVLTRSKLRGKVNKYTLTNESFEKWAR